MIMLGVAILTFAFGFSVGSSMTHSAMMNHPEEWIPDEWLED